MILQSPECTMTVMNAVTAVSWRGKMLPVGNAFYAVCKEQTQF